MNIDAFSNPGLLAQLSLGNKVTLESMNMIQTGTYNPLFARSYSLNSKTDTIAGLINNLSERVLENGISVTPTLVAGLAGDLITPSADVGNMLSIPNGWDTCRFRYNARVRVDLATGHNVAYDIQGYSDHFGISHGDALDENMRFYINSITRVANIINPLGQSSLASAGSSQILNGAIAATPSSNGVFAMRPKDVIGEIQWGYMQNDAGAGHRDGRANIAGRATGSSRNNSIPSIFLSDTLSNWLHTSQDSDMMNERAVVNNTLAKLQENFYEENHFVRALISKQGAGNGGYFTFRTLSLLDNTFTVAGALIQNRLNVIRLGGITNEDIPNLGDGSQWNGRDIEAIWSSTLAQAIPAIMSKHFVGKLAFTSTNMIVGGGFKSEMVSMRSPNAAIMNQIIAVAMLGEIETTILKDLTKEGLIHYNLAAEVDIYGTTKITLGIENRPVQTYFMPSFADALSTPVLTHNKNDLTIMANGMESILRKVVGNVLTQDDATDFIDIGI